MHTVDEWWDRVSSSEEEMINWLYDQYRGEITAAERIGSLSSIYNLTGRKRALIDIIAIQEKNHAEWIKDLLVARSLDPVVKETEDRYWKQVLKDNMSFEYVCAIGFHAEKMRLSRIELLSSDNRFKDIAKVFKRIYNDESFHVKAFRSMSTDKDVEDAEKLHMKGLEAIGLMI